MADAAIAKSITYSFVDPALQRSCFPTTPAPRARQSDLGGTERNARLAVARTDRRPAARICAASRARVRLFEIGKKFDVDGRRACAKSKRLPASRRVRAGRSNGAARARRLDFYDVKADVESCWRSPASATLRFAAEPLALSAARAHARESIAATTPIGWLGELHPQLVTRAGICQAPCLFELETESAFASNT